MQLFLIVLAFAAFFAYALWSSRLGRPGGTLPARHRPDGAGGGPGAADRPFHLGNAPIPGTARLPLRGPQLCQAVGPPHRPALGTGTDPVRPGNEHWYPVSALQSRKAVILSFALLLILLFCLACACKLFPRLGPFLVNHLFAGLFFLAGLAFAVGAPHRHLA